MAIEKLRIAVLGAGNIGGTIGRKWANAGHQVAFGVSNPNGKNAQVLQSELGDKVQIGLVAEALSTNPDVVFMALPGAVIESIIEQYASQLDNRVVIDTANRMGGDSMNSFAALKQHTPHARIYRAFNTYGAENYADPLYDGVPGDLFFCGNDGDSRSTVEQLISAVGMRPVYLGGVEQVDLVDSVTRLWFALAFAQKKGRHLAFKSLGH